MSNIPNADLSAIVRAITDMAETLRRIERVTILAAGGNPDAPECDCKPAPNSRREPVNVIINNPDGGVDSETAQRALRRIQEGGGL